ncbi:MAG TPA: tRNA pseudouridine(38-40) synthase TruA [Fodinibius sp.]|nr:tRNA pseudouridine(38-40) synthase TruA [Fodinibius sp.]
MPRYKLTIEFAGTNYCGWQRQPNGPTVEEEIERSLNRVLGRPIDVVGQGRTDSGVHAEGQTAHFDSPDPIDIGKLKHAFLGVLPRDIAVWNITEVPDDFHARFDASFRQYCYRIARYPRPLIRPTSILVLQELDFDAMESCARQIQGVHNFDSFTKPDNQNPSSECKVYESRFSTSDGLWCYHIRADRFVRHLVRRLVGTMLEVGKGRCEIDEFENLLHQPDKNKHAHGAPAKGLILKEVGYQNC